MNYLIRSILTVVLLSALPLHAQTIAEVGTTETISTLPGSPTDYIFFNNSTYDPSGNGSSINDSPYSDLNSFSFFGGVQTNDGNGVSIYTPGGATSVVTGNVQAQTPVTVGGDAYDSIAIGILATDNPDFNYNDFNVYVVYSNTNGASADTNGALDDSGIFLESEADYGNSSFANLVSVTDNNTSTSEAYVVEFNVQGFAAQLEAGNYLALGALTDINPNTGDSAYIGAVSFESVPEPSTWALMAAGIAFLGFRMRGKLA